MRLLVVFVWLLCLASPACAGQELTFAYIGGPLSYSSYSVLKTAYAKLGIDVKAKKLPGARSLDLSDAGMTDGEVHRIAAIAKTHPNLVRIAVPINVVEGMAISCGKGIETSNSAIIPDYRIGVKIGNVYAERYTQDMPHVTRLPEGEKLLAMLLADRLDFILADRPWAEAQAALPNQECLRINELPLVEIPLYHYLHASHLDLVPRLTHVLQGMLDSGEMAEVRRKAKAAYASGFVEGM